MNMKIERAIPRRKEQKGTKKICRRRRLNVFTDYGTEKKVSKEEKE